MFLNECPGVGKAENTKMPRKTKVKAGPSLFDSVAATEETDGPATGSLKDTTSTFADNLGLAVHRWFRYSAGFSAPWVREVIEREKAAGRSRIFDPFAGSGTVALEAERCQVESTGIEAHPFVARIAQAKLNWRAPPRRVHQVRIVDPGFVQDREGAPERVPRFDGEVFPA